MKLLVLIAAFLMFGMGGSWSHDLKYQETKDLQPGDVGYDHERYHETYKRLVTTVNGDSLQPSDEKYMSDKFGPTYQKLYSGGKCSCKSGYCRPSKWRPTELGSPTGYDILVNRQWVPVPKGALHNEKTLPLELWKELMRGASAHVCAYPDVNVKHFGQRVECAIVPDNVG
jgi:hypothetical protein